MSKSTATEQTITEQQDPRKHEGQQQEQQRAAWDGKVQSLPEGAQRLIRDLRTADCDERVAAKNLRAAQKAVNPDAKGDEKPPPPLTHSPRHSRTGKP
ncbi:hypothetical protein OIT41_08685 [Arthrobacter sp. YA7-1]|uniref:hypothetical protein n=1 Tax=Arthrobacter sp. YA7-1 TaxID=2987701 RepID=UPI002226C608|nr:hypothetical protein [Arthrobacter sp. YA7-1]UYY83090.1 hypothetical protein OIT41_08685 [Arthrobacter sp. YA7-1]